MRSRTVLNSMRKIFTTMANAYGAGSQTWRERESPNDDPKFDHRPKQRRQNVELLVDVYI